MPDNLTFLMAGGGTGGHVIPAIAVARELRARGHEVRFVGTERGAEARLVPQAGFPLEFIRIGGVMGVSLARKLASAMALVSSTLSQWSDLGRRRPNAIFSMGGYVAGPPVLAALIRRIPIVVMEPNAIPGLTNRWIGCWVAAALVNFPVTRDYFRTRRTEVIGMPVREEFFELPRRESASPFTILITGGSQGSRTLNMAARSAWPKLAELGQSIYVIHQTGSLQIDQLRPEFERSGVNGEISAFIADMPAAFARADLIICRSGAGAVSEVAAAGKPSVLIPFPFAADDHQTHNAERLREAGAAILHRDSEWSGDRFVSVVRDLLRQPEKLRQMSEAARSLARPGAAQRAADILEEIARKTR
jgi:UDP-N-acetylglucosamine--N-acetylmuramyl-(pentapeptide) pyrophosphoryl-undecaprenol N-acetylglucosamine transferase